MAILPATSILSFLLLVNHVLALQVTPNSPCAAVCLDDQTKGVSDPNTSNTFGKDIVCRVSNFSTTVVGEKFESCINCLQTSTYSNSGESDQEWFLYNIRYAFDTCLFGFENASDPISTPCSMDNSCGHLQKALENGDLDPNKGTYEYCSADDNAFLGSFHDKCHDCLKVSDDTKYLANFLTALKAGCVQQPPSGTIIGIQGSVFSANEVNITFPGYNQHSNDSHKKGLSQSAIIGIAVGLAILVAIIVSILLVCLRKHRNLLRTRQLTSPLDPRFGAKNITSPNSGSYGIPYTAPRVKISRPFDDSILSSKERQVLGIEKPVMAKQGSISTSQSSSNRGSDTSSHRGNQLPPYSGPAMPRHQAYIPEPASEGPVPSIASSNNYQLDAYSSSITSPQNSPPPPPPNVSRYEQTTPSPVQVYSPKVQSQISSWQPTPSPPYVQRVDTRLPPRSNSRAQNAQRSAGGIGIGNAYTSQSSPVDINGQVASHSRRFDFEQAERERQDRELREQMARRRKADFTPESAESEEQWPGSY